MRAVYALTLPLVVAVFSACEEPKPDRLQLDPAGPFRFDKKADTETLKVAAFRGAKPYVKAVPVEFESSDTAVVKVDENGVLTPTGSGEAKVSAQAWGLSTSADVKVQIVGSIAIKEDVPKPYKLNAKKHQLQVTVKDDKGQVIEKPKVTFRATDYCVEVDETTGLLTPLTEGDCDVVASAADQYARIKLQVKE